MVTHPRPLNLALTLTCGLLGASPALAGEWTSAQPGGLSTLLYRPTAEGAVGRGRPLFVALHGCAQQATALRDFGNWEAAEAYGAVIALPSAPNGGVYAGCWDYYGVGHTRANRHNGPVLQMVQALLDDDSLGIDPDQVYIAGLSSGGGEAGVLGCLAPDVFAGVGINAGPAVGTSEAEIATPTGTPEGVAQTCRQLAGDHAEAFGDQMTAVLYGDRDAIVATGYGPLNAQGRVALYGLALQTTPIDVSALAGYMPDGQGQAWGDAGGERVSLIEVAGMGHAWPAGTGDSFENQFVAARGVDWFDYLMGWFAAYNPRLDSSATPDPDGGVTPDPDAGVVDPNPPAPPSVTLTATASDGGCLQASGQVETDGASAQITLIVGAATAPITAEPTGRWQGEVCGLDVGCYQPEVVVITAGGEDRALGDLTAVGGGDGAAPVDAVEDTLVGHTSRLRVYPGGYGVADATYLDLLNQYGTMTPFTLYQSAAGDWYADPANIPSDGVEAPDCEDPIPPSAEPPEPEGGAGGGQSGGPAGGAGGQAGSEGGQSGSGQDGSGSSGGPTVASSGGCQSAPGQGGFGLLMLGLIALGRAARRRRPDRRAGIS